VPRPLRAVADLDTGELQELPSVEALHAAIEERDAIIRGLQRDIRGWTRRYEELARDKRAEAEAHPMWPLAVRVFAYWRQQCRHPRAAWSAERFDVVLPFLRREDQGPELCLRAIDGAAFDCWTTVRRNGSTKRHDGWETVFTSAKFEDFCNRAPRGWTCPPGIVDTQTAPPKRGRKLTNNDSDIREQTTLAG
jgi:hypothetical protein